MFSHNVKQPVNAFQSNSKDDVFAGRSVWSNGHWAGNGGWGLGRGWNNNYGSQQPQPQHQYQQHQQQYQLFNRNNFMQIVTQPMSQSVSSSSPSSSVSSATGPLSPLTIISSPQQQQHRVQAVGPFTTGGIWSPIGTELNAKNGVRRAIRKTTEPMQHIAPHIPIYKGWTFNECTPNASPAVQRRIIIDQTAKRSDKFDFKQMIEHAKILREQFDKHMLCNFCLNNHETEEIYTSHGLKDANGKISCPILQAYKCPKCHATGDKAHTIKYCPIIQKNAKFNKIKKFALAQRQ